jgi:hypothetical protein
MSWNPAGMHRFNLLRAADWLQGGSIGISKDVTPLRTVYNAQTRQYEDLPLPEFQRLLRQGKFEESVGQNPYDGRPQRIFRLN